MVDVFPTSLRACAEGKFDTQITWEVIFVSNIVLDIFLEYVSNTLCDLCGLPWFWEAQGGSAASLHRKTCQLYLSHVSERDCASNSGFYASTRTVRVVVTRFKIETPCRLVNLSIGLLFDTPDDSCFESPGGLTLKLCQPWLLAKTLLRIT